ncbi:MAG: FAD-binding protein [Aliifodinibius sp.]|nr:FAD-binding protein [Fodinibius sp.]
MSTKIEKDQDLTRVQPGVEKVKSDKRIKAISPGSDGFYHPANEDEIVQLVKRANEDGLQVRASGSHHSVHAAIFTDHFEVPHHGAERGAKKGGEAGINILLDRMINVKFHDNMRVTVQAGCHLGKDPADPTKTSTEENSLFYQLDRHGWALPTMGGIIHQTVAGFMSTGSAGGTLQHSLGEHIAAIRLVDGKGEIHELSEAKDSGKFFAAGVSMGLFGIITAVTFKCLKKFHVIGEEVTTKVEDCKIDLFGSGGNGKPSLQKYLEDTEHARLLWWPQKGAEKITVWEGHTMRPEDYNSQTGSFENFKPKPYKQFPELFNSNLPAQIFAGIYYRLIKRWNAAGLLGSITRFFLKFLLAPSISFFAETVGEGGRQSFWDTWWKVLPMDNKLSDKWIPFEFMEMWVDISKTQQVMNQLKQHFEQNGLSATGVYPFEFYVKKKSEFWMSPAYGKNILKINFFWFGKNKENPSSTYFPQFWKLFREFDYRLHWGKYLPEDPLQGVQYLRARFPQWDDFMKLRAELDPNQIFVSDYWRKKLGIAPSPSLAK